MGTDIRAFKDPTSNAFGKDLYAAAQKPAGEITPVGPYMFAKAGTTAPLLPKVSFVERANNDVACGVGYYKEIVVAGRVVNFTGSALL
jgi:hypothetical protein